MLKPYFFTLTGKDRTAYINFEDVSRIDVEFEDEEATEATIYIRDGGGSEPQKGI